MNPTHIAEIHDQWVSTTKQARPHLDGYSVKGEERLLPFAELPAHVQGQVAEEIIAKQSIVTRAANSEESVTNENTVSAEGTTLSLTTNQGTAEVNLAKVESEEELGGDPPVADNGGEQNQADAGQGGHESEAAQAVQEEADAEEAQPETGDPAEEGKSEAEKPAETKTKRGKK